jgi:hypothetical protein
MNSTLNPKSYLAAAALTIVAGCSGATGQTSLLPTVHPQKIAQHHVASGSTALYVYVSNRTAQGSSELLVYNAGSQNPAPIRTVKKNLIDAGGIAVDASGNVYVANGSGGNVLEYAPGGASLVKTYSQGLADPSAVTVANGTLYVADRGSASNGYAQQVIEYPVGNPNPSLGIAGVGSAPDLNEGIAVNPTATQGTFFASASTMTMIPFNGGCSGNSDTVANDIFPTLWMIVPLSQNEQAPGLAFDAQGNLYASDPCNNDVAIYSDASETWTYTGKVQGTFNAPLFLTIDGQYLAVPSEGNAQSLEPGYVTVIDLSGSTSTVTITNGVKHPIGAAVGPQS